TVLSLIGHYLSIDWTAHSDMMLEGQACRFLNAVIDTEVARITAEGNDVQFNVKPRPDAVVEHCVSMTGPEPASIVCTITDDSQIPKAETDSKSYEGPDDIQPRVSEGNLAEAQPASKASLYVTDIGDSMEPREPPPPGSLSEKFGTCRRGTWRESFVERCEYYTLQAKPEESSRPELFTFGITPVVEANERN
ncbi:hypothetical protein FRB99_003657, partial [Tulasnella sp. 403]